MPPTRCYLIRHAQTIWNRDNRLQGHSDLPLSPLGLEQAARLARWFASRPIRGIFTSALKRSRQTAQTIAQSNGHRLEPIVEPDLGEMHLGDWEGLTPEEVDARFDGAYQRWKIQPSSVRIPNAESLAAFRERARRALRRVRDRIGEGEYLIVSHGGLIAAMLSDALDADYDVLLRRLRLDNAGVTALEWVDGPPAVCWVNATAHLHDPAVGRPQHVRLRSAPRHRGAMAGVQSRTCCACHGTKPRGRARAACSNH